MVNNPSLSVPMTKSVMHCAANLQAGDHFSLLPAAVSTSAIGAMKLSCTFCLHDETLK